MCSCCAVAELPRIVVAVVAVDVDAGLPPAPRTVFADVPALSQMRSRVIHGGSLACVCKTSQAQVRVTSGLAALDYGKAKSTLRICGV